VENSNNRIFLEVNINRDIPPMGSGSLLPCDGTKLLLLRFRPALGLAQGTARPPCPEGMRGSRLFVFTETLGA